MKTIAICGSMDFSTMMSAVGEELRARGFDVWLPAAEETKIDYSDVSDVELVEAKGRFIDEHLRKIRASDAIIVVNMPKRGIEGYVGANTLMEIAFAYALGKKVFVLNCPGNQPCRPELLGLRPSFLNGDLNSLRL